jgi:hypothetical protein
MYSLFFHRAMIKGWCPFLLQALAMRRDQNRQAQFAFADRRIAPIRLLLTWLLKCWHSLNDNAKVCAHGLRPISWLKHLLEFCPHSTCTTSFLVQGFAV